MKITLRSSLTVVIPLLLILTFIIAPSDIYASSHNIKTTVYRNTLKSGDTVYCSNAHRIFKVDLNNNEVKKLATSKVGYVTYMKIKNGYLYYMDRGQYSGGCRICRINLENGKRTTLAKNTSPEFAMKGKKIYYNYAKATHNGIKHKKRVMNLNGSSKKSTKYKAKMVQKLTNADGYVVLDDIDDDYDWGTMPYINYYLRTPDGDIFLESYYPMI